MKKQKGEVTVQSFLKKKGGKSAPSGGESGGMLQETQEQLNRIAENVPGILYQFLMRKDGTFACPYVSDSVLAMGLDPLEVTADVDRIFELIHPEDLSGMITAIQESARTLSDWRWEGRMVIGGKKAWYKGASRPRRLENGDILWDGLMMDITDQVELRQKLEQAEEDCRSIFENTTEGVIRSTLEGSIIMANLALARMLGYDSPQELMDTVKDTRAQLYVDPARRDEAVRMSLEKERQSGFEAEVFCRDGSRKWVLISGRVVRHENGNVRYFEGVVKDITDRVHTRELLKQSEERYRLIVENLPVVTYFFSPGVPAWELFISGKVRELTGYTEGELMKAPALVYDMMHPEDREEIREGFEKDLQSGSNGERIYRIVTREGVKWVRDRYYFTRDDEGNLVRIYGFLEDISQRKKVEEELTTIMSSMTDMIALADLRGVFQFVTPSCEIVAGYRPEELVGRDCLEYVHPDDREQVLEAVKKVMEGEKIIINYRVRHRDGHYIWVDNNATAVYDRNGNVTGVVSGHRNITDRILAEEALGQSEEKYRLMIENIPLVVYFLNPTNPPTRVFVSGRVKEVTGYSTEDYLHDSALIIAIVHPADRAMVLERARKSIKGNIPLEMEYRIITRDGMTRWLRDRFVPVPGDHGNVKFVYGIVEDITRRKKVEVALKESEARYRSMFENAVDGVFQTTADGNFISANPALARMAGYASTEDMLKDVKNIADHFYVDPEDRKRHLGLVEKEGFVSGFDVPCKRRDGSVIWVSFSTRVVKQPDGTTAFYEGTIEDITLRKKVEMELQTYKENLERLVDTRTAELQEREKELWQKSQYLQEANTALKVLLGQREKDTREVQEAVLNNIRELILPHMEKLKLASIDGAQRMYLDIIEKNLETIVSPFSALLKRMNTHLTPQEIQVANLVKQGHSSKTISDLLNLSTRTVDCHRANIRKKLGIRNKKANLRTRLGSLEG